MKKKVLFSTLSMCLLAMSCGDNRSFGIEGRVSGAEGQLLYLERVSLALVEPIDSIRTDNSGTFRFNSPAPAEPTFYRLRMGNQIINLGIDSVEQVKIFTDSVGFAVNYTVENSAVCQSLKEITMKQQETDLYLKQLKEENDADLLSDSTYIEQALGAIGEIKDFLRPYITRSPQSLPAYYALFQKVRGGFVFDPYDKDDLRFYTMAANVLKLYYPDNERTRNLEKLAVQGLSFTRAALTEQDTINLLDAENIGIIDIALPSIDGEIATLSEYAKGGVTLLDFTVYGVENSPLHNMLLGELYEKYHDKGFKIYQVSFDNDEHIWKNKASKLPWMCVLDGAAIQSRLLAQYNVAALPTSFIIDKEGDITKRLENEEELRVVLEGCF